MAIVSFEFLLSYFFDAISFKLYIQTERVSVLIVIHTCHVNKSTNHATVRSYNRRVMNTVSSARIMHAQCVTYLGLVAGSWLVGERSVEYT